MSTGWALERVQFTFNPLVTTEWAPRFAWYAVHLISSNFCGSLDPLNSFRTVGFSTDRTNKNQCIRPSNCDRPRQWDWSKNLLFHSILFLTKSFFHQSRVDDLSVKLNYLIRSTKALTNYVHKRQSIRFDRSEEPPSARKPHL